jgi:hypothetical protein
MKITNTQTLGIILVIGYLFLCYMTFITVRPTYKNGDNPPIQADSTSTKDKGITTQDIIIWHMMTN